MNLSEDNKLLQSKNQALSTQLDKITDQMFAAQEVATDLKNQLEEKKHSEQLGGWAIDRAIEIAKLSPTSIANASRITEDAQTICDWIMANCSKTVQKITTQKRSMNS